MKRYLSQFLICLTVLSMFIGAAFSDARGDQGKPEKKLVDKKVKIALVGDSTVSAYKPESLIRGWGEYLGEHLSPSVQVDNYARSGASTKTFPKEKWELVLKSKPDYVLIQFGHNDSHAKGKPESTDAETDYRDNLRQYIDQARAEGIEPILVTPVHRRRFTGEGKVTMELEPYAKAMRAVAAEKNVRLIDLHASSGELFEKLGDEGTEGFTVNHLVKPDLPGKGDLTHFTKEGARAVSALVARDLIALEPSLAPSSAGK